MSKKTPVPSGIASPDTGSAPATARIPNVFPSRKAFDAFLASTSNESVCSAIVEEIVVKASQMHLSNHYDELAIAYTANGVWSEMMALVVHSFISLDAGMDRPIRPTRLKHVDASTAWSC